MKHRRLCGSKSTWSMCTMFRNVDYRELFILCMMAIVMAAYIIHLMSLNYINSTEGMSNGTRPRVDNMCDKSDLKYFSNGSVDFRGFNNYTGYPSGCYVVPDIVHLIKFNQDTFSFIEMICIASVLINHKPNRLMIHTNAFQFQGKYWAAIKRLPNFNRVRVVYLMKPTSIYGFSLEHGYGSWHASDIARLRLIQTYGGIYFDSDVFVVQSMHPYRRFEFGLEWNYHMNLGNQVLFGHRDARVISHWLETYKQYNGSLWYYNGGVLPTQAVLYYKSELIHRVRDKFGTDTKMLYNLYETKDWPWQEYHAIHLFNRHQKYIFNESSVLTYVESPIKQMILSVMPDYIMYPTLEEKGELP
uniref:Alpha-1,4-N-acetylglucosaminyltransferase n=1 Tax=Cacopsylla melanoneura TaxID=428564 RepID=A0A8D8ZN82_9HEMI